MDLKGTDIRLEDDGKALFINSFTATEETYRDFATRSISRGYKVVHFLVGTMFMLFFLFYALYALVNLDERLRGIVIVTCAIGFFIVALSAYLSPKLKSKRVFRESMTRFRLLNAGSDSNVPKNIIYFRDSEFEFSDIMVKYSQISKTSCSSAYMFIVVENAVTIIVKKDAFTKGDYDSFLIFMKDKLKDNPKALKGLK